MPVQKISGHSRVQLRLQIGTDDNGNPIYRTRTYSNIKEDRSDEDVFEIANTLGGLQEHPINNIIRVDQAELVES